MEGRVIVVGGGHNGLVAAAYLAKRGLAPLVLERRDVVGGAAVSEQPWGPDFTVTALSYVVSLMPPTILRQMFNHPLTDKGLAAFLADWAKTGQSIL